MTGRPQHAVTLVSIEDDARDEQLRVVWELERGAVAHDQRRRNSCLRYRPPAGDSRRDRRAVREAYALDEDRDQEIRAFEAYRHQQELASGVLAKKKPRKTGSTPRAAAQDAPALDDGTRNDPDTLF